jgi:hypothetical protein
MDDTERQAQIRNLLAELKFVRGSGAIIWHQRVFSDDYGWGDGYRYLLQTMQEMEIAAA